MDLKLRGAAVLVTGGSRGLGRDFALGFAEEGADVAICARDRAQLDATAAEIRAKGVKCVAISANLFEGADCQRVVDETAAAFGRLDVLVNNASTSVDKTPRSLEEASDNQLLERFLGKTMAAMRCARAALTHMRQGGGGRIVNIGGTAARSVFRPGELLSNASGLPQGLGNSSLANFSKYLAEEAAPYGVLVNVVHPHVTRTSRHPARLAQRAKDLGVSEAEAEAAFIKTIPLGRMIESSDVTPLVLFLASPLAGATTGQALSVDGGALRGVNY